MNKKNKRTIGLTLTGVMSAASIAGAYSAVDSINAASASTNTLQAVHAKIEHITYSLKNNYLGLKNVGQWQQYIKEAKALNAKLPKGSSQDKYSQRINKAEALINAAARVNHVEKSMAVNALIIKNVSQWDQYINLAKEDLAKVDLSVFKPQYNNLLERTSERSAAINKVKADFDKSLKAVEALYNEASELAKTDSTKALDKLKEAKAAADKLNSHTSKDELIKKIEELTKNVTNGTVKPQEPSTGGGGSGSEASSSQKAIDKIEGIVKGTDVSNIDITVSEIETAIGTGNEVLEANLGLYKSAISTAEDGDLNTAAKIKAIIATINDGVKQDPNGIKIESTSDIAKLKGTYKKITIDSSVGSSSLGAVTADEVVVKSTSDIGLGANCYITKLTVETVTNIIASPQARVDNVDLQAAATLKESTSLPRTLSNGTNVSVRSYVFGIINISTMDKVVIDVKVDKIELNAVTGSAGLVINQPAGAININSKVASIALNAGTKITVNGEVGVVTVTSPGVEIISGTGTVEKVVVSNGVTATIDTALKDKSGINVSAVEGKTITIQNNNGADISSLPLAVKDDVVTVTVKAKDGYKVQSVSASATGNPVTITSTSGNDYAFTMPDDNVTITVTTLDYRAINTAIEAANLAKKDIKTSADGTDIVTTEKWVTSSDMTDLDNAIKAATDFKGALTDSTTAADVTNKTNDLNAAVNTFNRKIKQGTDVAAGARAEAAKITDKVTFEVEDADKADVAKVTKAAVEAAQKIVASGYTVSADAGATIATGNKLTVKFVVKGTAAANTAKTGDLQLTFTVKPVQDPAAGAKSEAAKIDNTVTFEVEDADKADVAKLTAEAVKEAQKKVSAGYTVSAKATGTISGDKLTVKFVVTGTEAANTAETGDLQLTFTVKPVQDTTAPTLSSATVNGTTLELTYSEGLDESSEPDAGDFVVSNGTNITVSNVSVSGSTVTLTLSTAVSSGDTVTVSYTPGTKKIQDIAKNAALDLTAYEIK